jgi:hypothetical protein
MRLVALSFLLALSALLAMPATAQVFSFEGAGPVQLGMTVETAERALGSDFAAVFGRLLDH